MFALSKLKALSRRKQARDARDKAMSDLNAAKARKDTSAQHAAEQALRNATTLLLGIETVKVVRR